jgi:hypothetical protein
MQIDKTCFANAKVFSGFNQSVEMAAVKGDTILDFSNHTVTVTTVAPLEQGQCFAYCCEWIRRIKADKRFVVDKLDTLAGIKSQSDYLGKFYTSGNKNALILEVGGIQETYDNEISLVFPTEEDAASCLTKYKAAGANFVMVNFSGAGAATGQWGHAICFKVDQSTTGGWLNWSYPCALFDPNIGQGMYSNMTDLAKDLANIINAYSAIMGPVNHVECTRITITTD